MCKLAQKHVLHIKYLWAVLKNSPQTFASSTILIMLDVDTAP